MSLINDDIIPDISCKEIYEETCPTYQGVIYSEEYIVEDYYGNSKIYIDTFCDCLVANFIPKIQKSLYYSTNSSQSMLFKHIVNSRALISEDICPTFIMLGLDILCEDNVIIPQKRYGFAKIVT